MKIEINHKELTLAKIIERLKEIAPVILQELALDKVKSEIEKGINMTNLEWLLQDKELLKEALSNRFGVSNGKINECSSIRCENCDFGRDMNSIHHRECAEQRKEWLEAEHVPLYKKGDVILTKHGTLLFVVKEVGKYVYVCTHEKNLDKNINTVIDNFYIDEEDVKKKAGNVYE